MLATARPPDRLPEYDEMLRRRLRSAERDLKSAYAVSTVAAAEARLTRDTAFCRAFLEKSALELGREALRSMRSITHSLKDRYIEQRPGASDELRDLARSLAAWLVYKAGAPYATLAEDEPYWRFQSRLGPPPEPAPPSPPPLPGGVRDPADAGVSTSGGSLQGPPLTGRWRPWGDPDPAYAEYPLAFFGLADANALKRRLLAPEAGGHTVLLMFEQRLDGEPLDPVHLYETVRRSPARRDAELVKAVGKVELYLREGLATYEENLRARDWEELRPLLVSVKALLFPGGGTGSPERRFADHLIGEIVGVTLRDIFEVATLVVGIALGVMLAVPTLGGSIGLSAGALSAALVAFDVGTVAVSIGIAVRQYEERSEANRFAAIDEALRVASATDDLTRSIAIDVLLLLVPPVAEATVRRGVRAAENVWARRASRAAAEEMQALIETPATRARNARAIESPRATGSDARLTTRPRETPPVGEARPREAPPVERPRPSRAARGVAPPADPFASLTTSQRRRISVAQTALTGSLSRRDRVPLERVHEHIRYFMSRGATLDEAVEQTRRWGNILTDAERLNIAVDRTDIESVRHRFRGHDVDQVLTELERSAEVNFVREESLGLDVRQVDRRNLARERAREVTGDPPARTLPGVRFDERRGLIAYGDSDLSQRVIQERVKARDFNGGNYAAVEFVNQDGDLEVYAMRSLRTERGVRGVHSEVRLIEGLAQQGIDPSRVTRLYTERSPCVTGANCTTYLRERLPPGAKVTWSFDYGTTEEVSKAMQHALMDLANKFMEEEVRSGGIAIPR